MEERTRCLRAAKRWNVRCIALQTSRGKGGGGTRVKVFARDKPRTSKVDVPSQWTPSGIHSTPCDRGSFKTARKNLTPFAFNLKHRRVLSACQRPLCCVNLGYLRIDPQFRLGVSRRDWYRGIISTPVRLKHIYLSSNCDRKIKRRVEISPEF